MGSKADGIAGVPAPLNEIETFRNRFRHLAESDIWTDCEFVVGAHKTVIKGHKALFCVASEVFNAMFLGDLKETNAVYIEDLEPDAFQGMKKYIYTDQTDFKSVFEALATYVAARKYLIEPLKEVCENYIKKQLQPSDVLEFIDSCRLNNISVFDDLCTKIINDNTVDVAKSDYFPSANSETIELILKSPSLAIKSEIEVFGLFERWALAEVERRKIPVEDIATSFDNLKKHIRFLTISGEDFVAHVEPSPLLSREEKYVIAMNKIKFNPNLTSENISMLQKSRRFNKSDKSDNNLNEQKHMFHIPINSSSYGSRQSTGIDLLPSSMRNHYDHGLKVYWINSSKLLCFEADVILGNVMKMVVIKSKFRVQADYEEDDLLFEKQSECVCFNNNNSYSYNSTQTRNRLLLAVIPKSTLKAEHYRNNNRNMINIEGSFTVTVEPFVS
ncbi:hypothetical protein LSTR_LSTR010626 [Laodelphax striatellus]|uniref:BTB domain-containing protein n=1 Tax=Laodelphax striatellus TaxID=195883 RepID=A0A482X5G1_LAOST|nr:hypothetical protein LSTR_LSTR010626 [Laodelphax striatellus]